ncbi:MAG: dihydrofolate reductase family protein [Patescibacteria group bacterium]|nr:dihydrofolate reductase family protein [Patescibacteria group bacterium]
MKVIMISAITIDGKIAKKHIEKVNWTGKADKTLFNTITKKAGVVIMGNNTFKSLGSKPLSNRLNIVLTRKPHKSLLPNLKFTDSNPQKILQNLQDQGFKTVFIIGGAQINTLFARANLIDEIWLTTVPIIFGNGLSLFCQDLKFLAVLHSKKTLGKNTLTHYLLKKAD